MNNLHRRNFLQLTGAAMASLVFPRFCFGGNDANIKRPNFIFILADDWGWGDLRCYGHPYLKTPNLDRLASAGILFTQFYVNSPACSPSRASILTGHFPARHYIHDYLDASKVNEKRGIPNFLDPTVYTVTKLLQNSGYTTAHFGKWHLGEGERYPGQGGLAPTPDEYGINVYHTVASNGNNKWDDYNNPYSDGWSKSTEFFIDETIHFIEANRDKSFYVNTWLLDTHAVLNPTEEQMKPYAGWGPPGAAGENHHGALQVYYGSVTNADKQIGRLLDKLDELGLSDNTIVIFSSDNGPEDIHLYAASHSGVGSTGVFRGRKRSLYEGGIRVPFIVRWPAGGVPAGKVDDKTILSAVDFLPTICSMASVKLPEDLCPDGQDMTVALKGKSVSRKKPLMWEWLGEHVGEPINQSPSLAIRDKKWKLLMEHDGKQIELYDIINDPMEVDSLIDSYPDIVKKLSKKLLDWQNNLPPRPLMKIWHKTSYTEYQWPKERD